MTQELLLPRHSRENEDEILYRHQENLWTPFAVLNPPIGSRLAFKNANSKKYRDVLHRAPSLDECLDLRTKYPLCVFGYREYLEKYEHNPQDLDFILDVCYLEKLTRASMARREIFGRKKKRDYTGTGRYPDNFIGKEFFSSEAPQNKPDVPGEKAKVTDADGCLTHSFCQKYAEKYDSVKVHSRYYETPDLLRSINGVFPGTQRDSGVHRFLSYEEIYFKYIVRDAINEIFVPDHIREQARLERRLARKTRIDLVQPSKSYVGSTMRQETYPRFIRECMLHNISPKRAYLRLATGLFLLICALTAELTLILLGRRARGWRILPFIGVFFGTLLVLAFAYRLDPFYATFCRIGLFNEKRTETIRDEQVLKSHRIIMLKTIFIALAVSVALFLLFYFIPATNL